MKKDPYKQIRDEIDTCDPRFVSDEVRWLVAEIARLRDALEDIASVDRSYVEYYGEPLAIDRIVARAKEALEGDDD